MHQTSDDGVLVHIVELLDALAVRQDVEVVVAGLPEGSLPGELRDGEFQGL